MSRTKKKFAKGAMGKTIPIYDFVPDHKEQTKLIDHGITNLYDLFCLSYSAIKKTGVDPEVIYDDITVLKTIPVSELNVPSQIIDSFQKNGIHTIGQVITSDLGTISLLSGVNDENILQIQTDLEHLSEKINYYRILSGDKPIIRKIQEEDDDDDETDIYIAIGDHSFEMNNTPLKKGDGSLSKNRQETKKAIPTVEKFLTFFEKQKISKYVADGYVDVLWDLETIANRKNRVKQFMLFDEDLKNCYKTVRYLHLNRKGSSWDTHRIRSAIKWYIEFLDTLLDINLDSDRKIHNGLQKLKTEDDYDCNTHFHSYYLGEERFNSDKEKSGSITNKKPLPKKNIQERKQKPLGNFKEPIQKASVMNNKNHSEVNSLRKDEPKKKKTQVDPVIIEETRLALEKLCEQNHAGVSPAKVSKEMNSSLYPYQIMQILDEAQWAEKIDIACYVYNYSKASE